MCIYVSVCYMCAHAYQAEEGIRSLELELSALWIIPHEC